MDLEITLKEDKYMMVNKIFYTVCFVILFCDINFCQNLVFTGSTPCTQELYLSPLGIVDMASSYKEFLKTYRVNQWGASSYLIDEKETSLVQVKRNSDRIIRYCIDKKKYFLEIRTRKRKIKFDTSEINSDPYLIFENLLEDSLGYEYSGCVEQSDCVKLEILDKIIITKSDGRSIHFKEDVFSRFINPFLTWGSTNQLRPKLLFSKDQNELVIYISGKMDLATVSEGYINAMKSYIVRITLNLEDEMIVDLSYVPGRYLVSYGWMECQDKEISWMF